MNDKTKAVMQRIIILLVIVLATVFIVNTNFIAKPIPKQTQIELEIISEINNQ